MPDDRPGTPEIFSTGPTLRYRAVTAQVSSTSLTTIAPFMFWLMIRNIASEGFAFEDPIRSGGCRKPDACRRRHRGRTRKRT